VSILWYYKNKNKKQKTDEQHTSQQQSMSGLGPEKRVCVIYAMAEVQEMGKPHWITSCQGLSLHFIEILEEKKLI